MSLAPALSDAPPAFERHPNAHRIASDAEAVAVARELAAAFAVEAAERDRTRRLPAKELDRFSGSGLWGITVPKAYGGAGVSFATLAEVIATISAADPSIGQIPQNHLAALDAIRVTASEEQKRLWFGRVLQGYRLGNAFSEARSRHVGAFETTVRRDGDGFTVDGEKFYATGALFAHYIHIGAVDEAGNVHLAIAERDAPGLAIIDNWSSFGQRTTASGNVRIEGVRVGPEALIPAYLGGVEASSNGSVSQIIQAAVDLGIARGAIAETIRFVREHTRPWIDSGQEHGHEDVFTIHAIGDLEVKLHTAEALLERAGLAIDAILDRPSDEAAAETAVAVALAKVTTTEIAILATNKLHELGGTRSTLGVYGLDRHWRNARTHTLHDPVRWKYFHVGNHALNGIAPPRHAWS
ncbi:MULTISPECIES: SfnB family sulfur acquisition oxidoreductase [unclassified Aureimonas]|uniref:SfnB family sulfur acquisition oxidoreductase n=1 Tax=unclassified Aureimonas TaxID=2615206 RepID=UPI0006FA942C|nr:MULTISPECIES: SfnB family sulfur acquisition oxidoreductase [unclassified Aureimonas]KQT69020.1 SfnB family sulfur acquisition oxidoreductase [Aureimonas sp. Leaf460]KQT69254.1 SfnB family sulfur acquisition oxidoreductase [Aureimonas sp. Leaf427]